MTKRTSTTKPCPKCDGVMYGGTSTSNPNDTTSDWFYCESCSWEQLPHKFGFHLYDLVSWPRMPDEDGIVKGWKDDRVGVSYEGCYCMVKPEELTLLECRQKL